MARGSWRDWLRSHGYSVQGDLNGNGRQKLIAAIVTAVVAGLTTAGGYGYYALRESSSDPQVALNMQRIAINEGRLDEIYQGLNSGLAELRTSVKELRHEMESGQWSRMAPETKTRFEAMDITINKIESRVNALEHLQRR